MNKVGYYVNDEDKGCFRIFAPYCDTLAVELDRTHRIIELQKQNDGYFTAVTDKLPEGILYWLVKNGREYLAAEEDLVFLCGHYEGVDERVLEEIVTDYVSIGDYVLTGGELPAMVMIDAISRLVPGVLNNDESALTESFGNGLLEYPQYSRPEEWMGKKVPAILLSGDHKKVDEWRLEQSIIRTRERRPDLYEQYMIDNPPEPEKKKNRRKQK